MNKKESEKIRQNVRDNYGKIAQQPTCGCCGPSSCCNPAASSDAGQLAAELGYSPQDIETAPSGANMGLGCGNPNAIAALKPGETVLDLGCGGGFDAFLAAQAVGPTGRVIGVDMTPEMIQKARLSAAQANSVSYTHLTLPTKRIV